MGEQDFLIRETVRKLIIILKFLQVEDPWFLFFYDFFVQNTKIAVGKGKSHDEAINRAVQKEKRLGWLQKRAEAESEETGLA